MKYGVVAKAVSDPTLRQTIYQMCYNGKRHDGFDPRGRKDPVEASVRIRESDVVVGSCCGEVEERIDREEALTLALKRLSFREREVIKVLHGLCGEKVRSRKEAEVVFKVTQERIRQIEKKALVKLAKFLAD